MIARLARVAVLLSAAVLLWVFVATAQSDPFAGTWRLNVAKSKDSPGPTPKSITSTYEAAGQGYKVSVTNESATGKTAVFLRDQSRRQRLAGEPAPTRTRIR